MKKYEISLKDISANYFHFTQESNLPSIEQNGLLPKRGKHAEYIEETKKVFFVQGLDNLLILFDCWINVYKKAPLLPEVKITYGLGSRLMRSKYFPSFVVDYYFKLIKNSKRHQRHAYEKFDQLFDNCILLHLDLEENRDFSFADIDQIKAQGYRRRHLVELGYSEKYSDVNSNEMDRWNLHTLTNQGVAPNKIKLCSVNNSISIRDIFDYSVQKTKLDLKNICPVLYDYLNNRSDFISEEC